MTEQPELEQMRLLVDAVADYAIFRLDKTGHIRSWNKGAERIKGYAAHEIIGSHFSRFYTEEDILRGHPQHELEIAAAEGRYEEEGWRVRKDGSRFWANIVITALRDESGELVGFGKVTRDLTARRLAEEQMRTRSLELTRANDELRQFHLLVSEIRDYGIFMLDPGGYIQTWNRGAELIKGYSEDEITGRHFSIFYTESDRERNHPSHELRFAAEHGRYEEEGWRVRKDGSRFWASVVITAVRDERGSLVGFGKVTRDLSERREAEEALRRTNEELERYASAAAHHLVEPLHTMVGLADLIADRYSAVLDDRGRELVHHLRTSAERQRVLIDGLLTYARSSQREVHHDPVDLAAAARHVVSALEARIAERGATVEVDEASLGTVLADTGLVELVLQNVVGNALKFARPGVAPHVRISGRAEHGGWRVTVDDDGIGVPPEHRESVFGLFQRLHGAAEYAGTGLGLPLSRRIVERHGGVMGIDSLPDGGTSVWFTLPETPAGD